MPGEFNAEDGGRFAFTTLRSANLKGMESRCSRAYNYDLVIAEAFIAIHRGMIAATRSAARGGNYSAFSRIYLTGTSQSRFSGDSIILSLI